MIELRSSRAIAPAAPSTAAVDELDELDPCVTCFDVVNNARPSEVGTISAHTDRPAITSCVNHDRS